MSNILSKEELLGMDDLKIVELEIPEWGNKVVRIKPFSGKQRDEFDSALVEQRTGENTIDMRGLKSRLVALSLVDEEGVLMFKEDEVELVAGKSASVIERIFEVAQKLNGIGEEAVKEAEKN